MTEQLHDVATIDLRAILGIDSRPEDVADLERELALRLAADAADLERDLLTRSLADFFRAGWHVLEPSTPLAWAPPYDAVCEHVQSVVEDWARRQHDPSFAQRIRDLLLTMPPGTLKSRIITCAVPWAWLRWPQLRCIALSCNPRVALRDSMYARDLIASEWYQRTFAPSWRIRDDSDSKGIFSNTAGGFRAAHGFDARIVGTRGDLILVDDPHDPEEAESDAQRAAVHERWDGSIANRTNDIASSVRIGAAQRTHEDDWSARRIAEGWAHLDLPMLHELDRQCTTPLGFTDHRTVEGECLHPERFPPAEIAKLRSQSGMTERRWACLYQGRPSPAGGALVKLDELRFWRAPNKPDASATRPKDYWRGPAVVLPTMDAIVIAADLAGGKRTERGDYNVIVAVGRCRADYYLLACWRERADFPEVQRQFRAMCARYPTARKFVEQAASGGALVASLQREISGLVGLPPQGDKVTRLEAVLDLFEAGNVHFDDHWPGLGAVVAELTSFPSARHDDFVDALTLALSQLRARARPAWIDFFSTKKRDEALAARPAEPMRPWCSACSNLPDPCLPCRQNRCKHEFVDGACRLCEAT